MQEREYLEAIELENLAGVPEETVETPMVEEEVLLTEEEEHIPFQGFDPEMLQETIEIRLTKREALLATWGLKALKNMYTREQHMFREIDETLTKFPEVVHEKMAA